jgi:hypothetical protein
MQGSEVLAAAEGPAAADCSPIYGLEAEDVWFGGLLVVVIEGEGMGDAQTPPQLLLFG